MRGCALTWPFCFGVRLGWVTARTPNPDPGEAVGRVYLLRGNAVIFSRGFGTICDRLRRVGLWAEDLRCVGDRWVRRSLIADQLAGRLQGPVILVGHSCGGRYALFTAQQLARRHIPIELLVCIDVAIPFAVPANVREAVHLYRSQRRIYPARPLRAAPGSAARIRNLDLDAPDSLIVAPGLHHLNITASLEVQDWVVGRVLETVGDYCGNSTASGSYPTAKP
jgi:pimeloyl-ACP methyl ester carboxylesterase